MRWVGAFVVAVAFFVLVMINLDAVVVQATTPAPAAVTSEVVGRAVAEVDGVKWLGPCWWREHRGQHVLYVEGDPFTMGYCNSRLAGVVMQRQESALHTALATFVPFGPLRTGLIRTLSWIYRELPNHLSQSHREEIAGLAAGYTDPFRELGPTYGRIVIYHAIHDISQAMVDNPILACSAFAATGSATSDGHTLLARNFDFEGGPVFDEDKVVIFTRPRYGLPFVSVAWAGMAGAVSGMNRSGIGVVLNAAGSDDLAIDGTPTTLVVRDILQYARSVDEAIAIIEARTVFVTDIMTIADGKTGELAVVEITPEQVAVRRSRDVITATNHLQHERFAEDDENGKRMLDGTTVSRHNRLAELVEQHHGALNPERAMQILRDRALPGGKPAGLGHRGTIDALIAAHGVVFDLTARRFWVSGTPHTLGPFVAYDLDASLDGAFEDQGAMAPDPLLAEGWDDFVRARELVEKADALDLDEPDEAAEAVALLDEALRLAPEHPPALLRLARAHEATGDNAGAITTWRRFLAGGAPYRKNAVLARERLSALGASVDPPSAAE